ncbi:MAG: polysaccharide deacetylase family protein [Chloroflexota bacterium]
MNFRTWLAQRDPQYIWQRGAALLQRYRFSPSVAMKRIDRVVDSLADYGCAPTFPTPGAVIESHPDYFRRLQDRNVEFAVHSYRHIDLKSCSPHEARAQLVQAAETFERHGLEVHGFRCPYLSWSDALLDVLPDGLFGYSSNQAVRWDVITESITQRQAVNFGIVENLYVPKNANDKACVPWMIGNIVEIPVCVPDDIQLHDGLELGVEAIIKVWTRILNRTHQRGELYNQMFHPELVDIDEQIFPSILVSAKSLTPAVWITRLRDISAWWHEKNAFRVEATPTGTGLQLDFVCSPRATILSRGLDLPGEPWTDGYLRLDERRVQLPAGIRPFIGIPAAAPAWVAPFLQAQGYIVDLTETASACSLYLDPRTLEGIYGEVALIARIEKSGVPLIRYWRWPDGYRSALCVSGDLDALTLWDYASRIVTR